MNKKTQFRFSIQGLPEGELLTVSEYEVRTLETLKAADGRCLDSLWRLARLYSKTGHFVKAEAYIQFIIDLTDDPEEHASIYLALGQIEEKRSDYRTASKYYRRALALESCSSCTWYFIHNNLGYSLNQIGEYEAAASYLKTALEIDPKRTNAYKNMALSFLAMEKLEDAAELFIYATQVDAADSRSLDHLESLVEAHPHLLVDIPNLQDRLEFCRQAVDTAREQQPDFDALLEKSRKVIKKRKW